jgi:hypothetical protein
MGLLTPCGPLVILLVLVLVGGSFVWGLYEIGF